MRILAHRANPCTRKGYRVVSSWCRHGKLGGIPQNKSRLTVSDRSPGNICLFAGPFYKISYLLGFISEEDEESAGERRRGGARLGHRRPESSRGETGVKGGGRV